MGRYRGDLREMQGRSTGDTTEMMTTSSARHSVHALPRGRVRGRVGG